MLLYCLVVFKRRIDLSQSLGCMSALGQGVSSSSVLVLSASQTNYQWTQCDIKENIIPATICPDEMARCHKYKPTTQTVNILIKYLCFFFHSFNTGIRSSVRDALLPPPSSALDGCSAEGRSSTGCRFRPNAPSTLTPPLRWLPLAFFCSLIDWSRAVRYHGDHFLKNTGKEEGCQ